MLKYLVVTVVTALSLTGCGFHLARTDATALVEHGVEIIAANSDRTLKNNVQAVLRRANVPSPGKWQLEIISIERNNDALVTNPDAFNLETLLQLRVTFQITDPAGNKLPQRRLTASRRLSQNLDRLNAASTLEDFYHTEAQQELARRMVRHLALIAETR